ncbi:MAG: L,D-transpeptidase family protein [Gammaproteobacteria bacterium]|nr:L,D-transpeptidase family protein [Gammaproteobacteria bacterium]
MYLKNFIKTLSGARIFHATTVVAALALMAVGLWLFAHRHDGALKQGISSLIERRDPYAKLNYKQMQAFYATRAHKTVWVDGVGPNKKAGELREVLAHAEREALPTSDYHLDEINAYWSRTSLQDLARLELLLTDAFMRYGVEVKAGYQFPRIIDPDWHIDPERVDPVAVLNQTVEQGDISKALTGLAPPHAAYRNLRASLQFYREILVTGEWPHVAITKDIKPEAAYADSGKLRTRLFREGYLSKAAASHTERVYDASLVEAVKEFQARHGLPSNGVLDRYTVRALNKPISERISEIEKNMERWRWMPRQMPERYISVNIADYKLTMYEKSAPVLDMKVIIGKKYRATPVIASDIEYVDLNPTWNVPQRIAREDMLPKQREDLEFFARKGIRVWSRRGKQMVRIDPTKVHWDKIEGERFPYYLEQEAGDGNSLGRIKFGLSNAFDIYLHDTPQRELFKNSVRAFSSGCIRVEQPEKLAAKVLEGSRWTPDRIANALEKDNTYRIALSRRLPVYIVYLTAWSSDGRAAEFRDDVYVRDRALPDTLLLSGLVKPGKLATAGI